MNRESERYGFARGEVYHTTLARLEEQFRDRAVNLEKWRPPLPGTLQEKLSARRGVGRKTSAQACREGMRLAGLQFLSQYREVLLNPLEEVGKGSL